MREAWRLREEDYDLGKVGARACGEGKTRQLLREAGGGEQPSVPRATGVGWKVVGTDCNGPWTPASKSRCFQWVRGSY